jgi:hypothetical protein
MLIIYLLYTGSEFESRLFDQALISALITNQFFLINQKIQSFHKGELLISSRLFKLALQSLSHAAKLEVMQVG